MWPLGIASSVWEMKGTESGCFCGKLVPLGYADRKGCHGNYGEYTDLAFAGSSLNMLILVQTYNIPFLQLINTDSIALEVVQSVAGSDWNPADRFLSWL